MAPRAPTTLELILPRLRAEPFTPIGLGSPALAAMVIREDGMWRVRVCEVDQQALTAFVDAQRAAGKPFFPEHVERFMRPTGAIVVEAADLDAFISALRASWKKHW